MPKLQRKMMNEIYKIIDIGALLVTLVFVSFYSSGSFEGSIAGFIDFFSLKVKLLNTILVGLTIVIWPYVFSIFGLYYYNSNRIGGLKLEFQRLVQATTCGALLLALLGFIFDRASVTSNFVTAFWILNLSLTFLLRFLMRKAFVGLRKRGRNLRHIIIIGNGNRGQVLAKKLTSKDEYGYKLLGFVDDGNNNGNGHANSNSGNVICSIEEFATRIKDQIVDEVFIMLPVKSYYDNISGIIHACEEQGVTVHIHLDFFNLNLAKTMPFDVEGTFFLEHYTGKYLDLKDVLIKRFIDVGASLFLIFLLSPLFILISILIKLTSNGSVFFVQQRVGYNKRRFLMYKFRTMVVNAELMQQDLEALNDVDGPTFKIKKDPRVTGIGKFLRKTSLDELPQLINVLIGDMSLVGPRPLPVRDVNKFNAPKLMRRFSVRPGMTGLWQINGRSDLKFNSLITCDLEYIDNWSHLLDIKIILKTVPTVLDGV